MTDWLVVGRLVWNAARNIMLLAVTMREGTALRRAETRSSGRKLERVHAHAQEFATGLLLSHMPRTH